MRVFLTDAALLKVKSEYSFTLRCVSFLAFTNAILINIYTIILFFSYSNEGIRLKSPQCATTNQKNQTKPNKKKTGEMNRKNNLPGNTFLAEEGRMLRIPTVWQISYTLFSQNKISRQICCCFRFSFLFFFFLFAWCSSIIVSVVYLNSVLFYLID